MTPARRREQREEHLERLVKAIGYFREHPPALVTRPAIVSIAKRFWVHPKTLEKAIQIMVEEAITNSASASLASSVQIFPQRSANPK